MKKTTLPPALYSSIGSENTDFVVKAGRIQPLKQSLSLIFFGTVWIAFTSMFVFVFLGPIFQGKEVYFESNNIPTVAGPNNLGPIVIPAIFIGVFILIGISMLSWGFYSLFKKGGYFVGTPTRLVHFQNSNIRSIDWEQFSGDIKVSGNAQKGNISLQMRTGQMVSRKNRPDGYIPETIYISKIPDVFKIEKLCRKRIKENDPTPPTTKYNII